MAEKKIMIKTKEKLLNQQTLVFYMDKQEETSQKDLI